MFLIFTFVYISLGNVRICSSLSQIWVKKQSRQISLAVIGKQSRWTYLNFKYWKKKRESILLTFREKKKFLQFAYMEDSKSIDNLHLKGTFLEGELIKVEIMIILFYIYWGKFLRIQKKYIFRIIYLNNLPSCRCILWFLRNWTNPELSVVLCLSVRHQRWEERKKCLFSYQQLSPDKNQKLIKFNSQGWVRVVELASKFDLSFHVATNRKER